MQRVTELVEQGVHLVVSEQGGGTRGGLGHIEVIDHDGRLPQQSVLRNERVHPRATALRVPRVHVVDVQPDWGAVLIADLEYPGARVVGDKVGALGEGDSVQLCGGEEHPIDQDAIGLKVGPHGRGIDVVSGLTHFLAVKGPVPRFESESVTNVGLKGALFVASIVRGNRGKLPEHGKNRLRILGRLIGGHPRGMALETEQSSAFGAQAGDVDHQSGVVVLIAPDSARS